MIKTATTKLSNQVWGLDWSKHLPCSLGEYTLEVSNYDEFVELKNSPDNFLITSENSNDTFFKEFLAGPKEAYLRACSDFFKITHHNVVVGVVICDLMDWSTYYLRYIFIDPTHRSNNLTVLFVTAVENVLRQYSLDKITCDVSSGNLPQMSRMSQRGYMFTGNQLSERFGSLVRLTKFINANTLESYNNHFNQSFRTNNRREDMMSAQNTTKEYL